MTRRSSTVRYPMRKALADVTLDIEITGMAIARVRLWLGVRLLKLAAFTMGVGAVVTTKIGGE